jgi:hypothetical protein
MTREQLWREALAASAGHLRMAEQVSAPFAERLQRAALSGRRPSPVELLMAARLSRELAEAQSRAQRLRALRRR